MVWLAELFRDPSIKNLNVDGVDRLHVHSAILAKKPILHKVFTEFHHTFDRLDKKFLSGSGDRIEIGAGIAPIRSTYADVLATDIVAGPDLDRILNAERMDLQDCSVRVIFGQNCFHHIRSPCCFFEELERVLLPGGGAILLEPYYGPFAEFLFPRMFRTERYDKNFPSWECTSSGPMNGANQALSYIVFKRDLAEFERLFPNLRIVHQEICQNYLDYLLSGGLNFRQLWPNWAHSFLWVFRKLLSPLDRLLALHHVIVISKIKCG